MKNLRAIFCLLGLTGALTAWGQTPAAGAINGIAHVAYRAADLDREVAFFQKLGYEEPFANTDKEGKVTEAFIKINDRQYIEIYPQTAAGQELGWMHVCYEADDLNALAAALKARGLNPSAVRKAGAGNLLSVLNDPEGRTTEFTQYMPGSRHTLDKGQHLSAGRVAEGMTGFALPVADMGAAKKFYAALGLTVAEANGGLRVNSAGAGIDIGIRVSDGKNRPETFLGAGDLKAAIAKLRAAGISFEQGKARISFHDPEGNGFVVWQQRGSEAGAGFEAGPQHVLNPTHR